MILSFSEDKFKDRILSGVKIHTIRTDRSERWKKGQIIHFWRGNPRNKNAKVKPHQFHEMNCRSVQKIEMTFYPESTQVIIDNRKLSADEVEELAIADGFDNVTDMRKWFMANLPDESDTFKGRLIHWTKNKY